MNQIQETLLILNHFANVIRSRTDFCKRNINFSVSNCITEKMLDKIRQGLQPKAFSNDPLLTEISRECADIKIILHSYICLNIIDMFSFNDEYSKFFNEVKFGDNSIKNRIARVKSINKTIRNSINWKQLGDFRNKVLAHNLRDKNNSHKFSIQQLRDLNKDILSNLENGIMYSEVVLKLFDNIEREFASEIIEAQEALKVEILKLN